MKPWQECSEKLIRTGELDPVYNLVAHARDTLGIDWTQRFCMAHLMFYNVAESIILADVEEEHFWFRVLQGVHTRPRGQERRHYRGFNALSSIDSMRADPPGTVFQVPLAGNNPGLHTVYRNLDTAKYLGFGDYFRLKWTDLLDVTFKVDMDYTILPKYLFDGAAKGLESIWPDRPHVESLEEIVDFIKGWADPFQGYRPCGISEAETIACAYRTYYVKTTYKFGWDINNLWTTLLTHGSKNAPALLAGLPARTEEWT